MGLHAICHHGRGLGKHNLLGEEMHIFAKSQESLCRGLSIGWKNERLVVVIPTFLFTVIVLSPAC